ncbi:MBL fold metallo-hydrolase [Desulfosporosinus sp. BICA1-9]|uniref:MBL fold metallo-hydrolase n=1 Tax=Desulfosporosinus sp. BICA1-9 TaxID=1531958 RepID=UPI00054C3DDA|nr:MBL fold metallo-hydrolase [Desulfosporosinus sp. BICA1-9]KJS50743.1 MAG: Zn-dependent hydrolase [Peptococcaceae bacterium BRH_c23]KJS90347.1 MAG: Zn-dependent hydrolase [Desulfosporosinus sp. BICA1-9]HBW37817.1 Zn-dependent hydrolase [Desulfosporosinus sp.]
MITEVYPNIFKNEIPLPKNPLKAINSYIILSERRNLIIDTGFNTAECLTELMKGLEELNIDISKTDLLITHMHSDHAGLAPALKKQGVHGIYFSQIDGEILNQTTERDLFFESLNQLLGFENGTSINFGKEFGARQTESLEFSPLCEGNKIVIGDYSFEVVDIPGHTPGQIGLYEKTHQLFFCGDHILDEITPNITFWGFEQDILATYFKSLNKVYEYEIDYLFTAHRKIIRDHRKRITELLSHHKERLQEILGILKEGRKTPIEMAASMHWDISHKRWADFPSSQKWFASGEALSHLEHLVHIGLVERINKDGVLLYELK